jgi:hypothetical protein
VTSSIVGSPLTAVTGSLTACAAGVGGVRLATDVLAALRPTLFEACRLKCCGMLNLLLVRYR